MDIMDYDDVNPDSLEKDEDGKVESKENEIDVMNDVYKLIYDDEGAAKKYHEIGSARSKPLPFTNELTKSVCGNLSYFNSNYQMKLAMILHLQSLLQNRVDTI